MFVAEFREDIQFTIPAIAEGVKDSDSGVRVASIKGLSRLAAQGMYQQHHCLIGVLIHVCS